jgi:choline dehydrogenase
LAARLSEDPKVKVLLLENGGSDKSIFIRMPTALSFPMNTPKYNWSYISEPEPYLDNRQLDCPRGKVLGGSSSINGMVYVRGHAKDFDEWECLGAKNWGYKYCLPYFKKAESWLKDENDYRGVKGPISVTLGNNMRNPLYQAFIDAGIEAGYSYTEDYNGAKQEGFGPMQMTVKGGVRCSTSLAYLKPIAQRKNLVVQTGALVEKVLLKENAAIGVQLLYKNKSFQILASKEVILSAGSVGSPHLLQLSGIGPSQVLKEAGIEQQIELPGVGENLQDHLEFYFQYKCKKPITLNGKLDWLSMLFIGARWFFFKNGLGASNHFESCGFIRSKKGVGWPDLQYHFLPAAMRYDGKAAFEGHGFQVHIGHNKPKSRGWVRAVSNNAQTPPQIQFNYLKEKEDIEGFRACVRLTREIIGQSAMDAFRDGEIQPGENIMSDQAIDAFIRENVESAYHPSCSCKMGEDALAVVDSEAKVHGVQSLRVVDSSIFPSITNGNLNAPTIMLAEKVADMIKGAVLPSKEVETVLDNEWQSRQREGSPNRKVEL